MAQHGPASVHQTTGDPSAYFSQNPNVVPWQRGTTPENHQTALLRQILYAPKGTDMSQTHF